MPYCCNRYESDRAQAILGAPGKRAQAGAEQNEKHAERNREERRKLVGLGDPRRKEQAREQDEKHEQRCRVSNYAEVVDEHGRDAAPDVSDHQPQSCP